MEATAESEMIAPASPDPAPSTSPTYTGMSGVLAEFVIPAESGGREHEPERQRAGDVPLRVHARDASGAHSRLSHSSKQLFGRGSSPRSRRAHASDLFAEDVEEQVRRTVGDEVQVLEAGRADDEAEGAGETHDVVEGPIA